MKTIIVSIKDLAVQAFQQPFTVRAKGEAVRGFQDAINNRDNQQYNKHAEDFELYKIGTFDDETGAIEHHEPELIQRGKDLVLNQGIRMTQ